jgi:hypothetical protein
VNSRVGEGKYEAEILQDLSDTRPTDLTIVRKTVTAQTSISVRMAKGGGIVVRIKKFS